MRICSRCKRELPEKDFYWDKFAGRFKSDCKDCNSMMKRHYYKQKKRNRRREAAIRRYTLDYFCGGVKIYIPYHIKDGEHHFNIVQTGHKIRETNSERVFLLEIKRILSEMKSLSQKYESSPLGQKNGE